MIGGKIIDASALAALVRGRLSALAWFDTAWALSVPLYLPALALAEVRAVRPDAVPRLAEVVGHPSVLLGERIEQVSTGPLSRPDGAPARDPGQAGFGVSL
ncbi:MAG TPA: hypothetical protein VFQ77_15700 [Pseudonocardiaceae bacterium]|nr:hypothetical protein [Pseudonocardiaceae bacterium]